jgi:hypothetical protein
MALTNVLHLKLDIKQVREAVTFQTYKEVPSSNLFQDTDYSAEDFHGFPQSLQANAGMVPQRNHDNFHQHTF